MKNIRTEKNVLGELLKMEEQLFLKTKLLFNDLMEAEDKRFPLVEYRLSEGFTLKQSIISFLSSNYEFDLERGEVIELLESWDNLNYEMKEVVEDNDSNTSWMSSRFDQYQERHKEFYDSFNTHYENIQ